METKVYELKVPGAVLHYQVTGQGPVLLTITGALGSKENWYPLTQVLKNQFTVVSYDRRGYSRSVLAGAQDYERMLELDADDAAAILNQVSRGHPAYVIGSSSGAIVALELLKRHPELIKMLTPHEPPANQLVADIDKDREAGFHSFVDIYRTSGTIPAIEQLCDVLQVSEIEKQHMIKAFGSGNPPYTPSNTAYWIEQEAPRYPATAFTSDMFQPYKDKLLLANSQTTPKHVIHFKANENLAKALDLDLPLFAGGHAGFATHAEAFAKDYVAALEQRRAI